MVGEDENRELLSQADDALAAGDEQAALAHLEEALGVSRAIGDRQEEASILRRITNLQINGAEVSFRQRIEEEIELHRELGDWSEVARCLTCLVQKLDAGDACSITANEEALAIFLRLGDKSRAAGVLHIMGRNHVDMGEYERAFGYYEESRNVAREAGDQHAEVNVLTQWARFLLWAPDDFSDPHKARRLALEALEVADRSDHKWADSDSQDAFEAHVFVVTELLRISQAGGGWRPEGELLVGYWFEWRGGLYLNARNDEADELFRDCENSVLLTRELEQRAIKLGEWYDTSLNWGSPMDPGPWRQAECDAFNKEASEFFRDLEAEWEGSGIRFINGVPYVEEHPDLDEYEAKWHR